MCVKNIMLFSTQDENYAILTINRLFALGFKPKNLCLVRCEASDFMYKFCEKFGLEIYLYSSNLELKKFLETKGKKVDLLLSIANKIIIKDEILHFFKSAINLHPGLLPNYKGFFSTAHAMINGDKFVGYTYHHISKDIDGGAILMQKRLKIHTKDTAFSLYHRILQDAILNLAQILRLCKKHGQKQTKQGKYYSNSLPNNGQIELFWSDEKIKNFIKAMIFPPFESAFVNFKGKKYFVNSFKEYKQILKGLK